MNPIVAIVAAILALALAAYHLRQRAGRTAATRAWSGGPTGVRQQLTLVPAVICLLAAIALLGLPGGLSGLCVLALLPMIVFTVAGGMRLHLPRWYLPSWLRDQESRASTKAGSKGPKAQR